MNKRIILVLRSGGDFNFLDAELLARSIVRKCGEDVEVVCLYDKVTYPHQLSCMKFQPLEIKWPGWWSKMNLFSPSLEYLRPFLFLDLDTVINGSLQGILPPEGHEDKFITLEDFYRKGNLASGMMWIPANNKKISEIWKQWNENPKRHQAKNRGDQNFLARVTSADIYWQSITAKISTFKPKGKGWRTDEPDGLDVVCFHGKPRIFEASKKVEWVSNHINETL